MAAMRFQNAHHTTDRVPGYYANNRLYPGSYARTNWPTRTSRRVHDGLSIDRNFGLDTTSDDIDSSPYSSPYYINGRYNSSNLVTQRGNSASVQGCTRLLSIGDTEEDFTDSDIQTYIEMWQGKQIKFELPYNGKVVGNTLTLKNTDGCTGKLSLYLSAKEDGPVLYETTIDLCKVSMDKFEHFKVYSITTIPATANPKGVLYARMEIWDEIEMERSANPFNTGKKIEIAATGLDNHYEAVVKFTEKNVPVNDVYDYKRVPSRPCVGLIYNEYISVPTNKNHPENTGATASLNGYKYDIFCVKNGTSAEVIIYDRAMNKVVENTDIKVDGRIEELNLVQAKDLVYYVDGYSPLQKFRIGTWVSEEMPLSEDDDDTNPVVAPSIIVFHNNRIYISGFRYDRNLVQFTEITSEGPDFDSYPYRFYSPSRSPLATSDNPITAIVECESDVLMITTPKYHAKFSTNGTKTSTPEDAMPVQVSIYTDGSGVLSSGDICNYHGAMYSFDQNDGIRRYNGSTWNKIPAKIDSHIERVDMSKPRKLWGYANKLYFNYTDKIDGKYKCIIWDMDMNYQQYPLFQDVDWPFCDIRLDEDFELIGIHPDYPCIMRVLDQDVWHRFDSPITFERWTKYLSMPGNSADMILRNVYVKVIANANRWWLLGVSVDKHNLTQYRGETISFRVPCWDTLDIPSQPEDIFTERDVYLEKAISTMSLNFLKTHAISVQVKAKCKTFNAQANLVSVLVEAAPHQQI